MFCQLIYGQDNFRQHILAILKKRGWRRKSLNICKACFFRSQELPLRLCLRLSRTISISAS